MLIFYFGNIVLCLEFSFCSEECMCESLLLFEKEMM